MERSMKARCPMVVEFCQQPTRAKQNAWQQVCQRTKGIFDFFSPRRRDVRVMKLYLIRHGETVDNVAQVYAGVRDSPLTGQGVLQAERLGRYLTASEQPITHTFASDLQRAVKTAEALLSAQTNDHGSAPVTVRQLPILREQDFGSYEGKPFYTRQRDSKKSGKDAHRSRHQDDPDFQDTESKESMTTRTNAFVAEHLRPLLRRSLSEQHQIVVIVSHGIILSHLWRSILAMFSKHTVSLAPGLSVGSGGIVPLEYLGSWSNTGYLELDITYPIVNPHADLNSNDVAAVASLKSSEKADQGDSITLPTTFKLLVRNVNGKEHLRGLKRARGVGSSQHDEGQKKIETFFKKAKTG